MAAVCCKSEAENDTLAPELVVWLPGLKISMTGAVRDVVAMRWCSSADSVAVKVVFKARWRLRAATPYPWASAPIQGPENRAFRSLPVNHHLHISAGYPDLDGDLID